MNKNSRLWSNRIILLALIIFYVIIVYAIDIIDNTDIDFNQGTYFQTIVQGIGADANVTLNYTTIRISGCSECGNMSAGQLNYTMTGNFTSQVFDTGDTTSVFDKIMCDSELPNGSNVMGYAMNTTSNRILVFYRNGSVGIDISQADFTTNVDFTGALRKYTIVPENFNYDDIVGFTWDDDLSNLLTVFFRNGSLITSASANIGQNPSFNSLSTLGYTIPRSYNTTNIIGIFVDTDNTLMIMIFKNYTYITAASESTSLGLAKFQDNPLNFTLPNGISMENVVGITYDSGADDLAVFLNNGSIIFNQQVTSFTTSINFTSNSGMTSATYTNGINITTTTNITLQTRVGNTTPITTPWSSLYINCSFISDVDVNNNVGRYIQYKAVFTTPDKYLTPFLENVSINYTTGIDQLFIEDEEINFSKGIFFRTNVTGSGSGANVTLNYTILGDSMSAGIRQYNTTGNFTSQIFDTSSVFSIIDNINWTINLPNSSDVIGVIEDAGSADIGAFYRNGSIATDTAQASFAISVDFGSGSGGGLIRYTLPNGFVYDDIICVIWDDDASNGGINNIIIFLRNGSTTNTSQADLLSNLAFTDIGSWTIPQGFNVSDAFGCAMDTQTTNLGDVAMFFRNGSYISHIDNEVSPYSFSTVLSYTIPASFNIENAMAVGFHTSASDVGIFFRNKTHIFENSQTGFTANIAFTDGQEEDTYTIGNLSERANITMMVRISNDSVAWGDWQRFENQNDGSFFTQKATINRISRYVQYGALFFTPDKYKTPALRYVSIDYTAGVIDITPPSGNLTTITNNSIYNSTKILIGSRWNETGDIRLYINWTLNQTELNVVAGTNFTFITNLSNGTYLVNATNTDALSNIGETPFFIFTIANVTALASADITFPIVNTTFNSSSPNNLMTVFNFTGNITDETGLSTANWTYNISGYITKINYTLSGTSAQVSNTTSLFGLVGGSVINFTLYTTDTSNNVKQNSTLITIADASPPIINGTLNKSLTNILQNDIINASFNMTDESNSINGTIVINNTGFKRYFNFSFIDYVAGNTQQMSQNFTISESAGAVINITGIAIDSSSNRKQNETVFSVADVTLPVVNATLNKSSNIVFRDIINLTANATDNLVLSFGQIIVNDTGINRYFNFSLSKTTSAQFSQNITIACFGGCVINFTARANDTSNNFRTNDTIITVTDNIKPIVNTTFNTTSPRNIDVINFTGNITDETGLLSANWTINFSTGKVFMNYTLSGTLAQVSNTTDLRGLAGGSVLNFTLYATDTSNNVKQNSTVFTITDALTPIVNTTFNISNALVGSVVNYTANITDETGLLSANWTVNLSTGKIFANYTLTGTSAQVSNFTSLSSCQETCVLNFTIYATDTSNNVKQNSTLITIADVTKPIVNTSFNVTNALVESVVNFTGNVTDLGGLKTANITINFSTGKVFANYTISGTSASIYNVTTITGCTETCVINFTMYATDTSNNVKQNSTLLIVADITKPIVNATFNVSSAFIYDIINYTANITDGNGLLSANWTINLSTGTIFNNFTLSGTTAQISNKTKIDVAGVYNFTIYAADIANNVKQNSTLLTIVDNIAPIINGSINATIININEVINATFNLTDETGLSYANITWNLTTGTTKINFTVSGTSIQISNVTRLPNDCIGGCVVNVTGYATDTSGNVKQNSTIFIVIDNIFPIVNASLNKSLSNILQNDIINASFNATDETGLSTGQVIINDTGFKRYFNFTLSGTRAEFSQNFTVACASGCVVNVTGLVNDTSNNLKQNETVFKVYSSPDITPPIVNTTFNNIAPLFNDVINFSCNITDETGLLYGNLTNNQSGILIKSNYTLSGTRAEISNTTNITSGRGSIINFTCYGTDTNNNVRQNSTLITIADTLGSIFIGINNTSPKINEVINVSGNATDADGDFGLGYISYNVSGNPQLNFSFDMSGTKGNFSQNITINLTRGNVINFTVFYNDTAGTKVQNSTLITVANTNVTISAFQPSTTSFQINFTTNITFNITGSDKDNDELTLIWAVNSTFNISNQNMSYIFNTIGVFNITGNLSDNFSTARQQWLVTTINDTQEESPSLITTPPTGASGGTVGNVPVCGNNVCEGYEDEINCPKDCLEKFIKGLKAGILEYRLITPIETIAGKTIQITNLFRNEGKTGIEVHCVNYFDINKNGILDEDEPSESFNKKAEVNIENSVNTLITIPRNIEKGIYTIKGICDLPEAPEAFASNKIKVIDLIGNIILGLMLMFVTSFLIFLVYLRKKQQNF